MTAQLDKEALYREKPNQVEKVLEGASRDAHPLPLGAQLTRNTCLLRRVTTLI